MRSSDAFKSFAVDQLESLGDVSAKAMFGGVGLYSRGLFFGIIAADVLYLKVDERSRPDYEQAGSKPFMPYAGRPMTMHYWAVPVEVLESAPTLVDWARKAVAVAAASAAAGGRRASPRAARGATRSGPRQPAKRRARPPRRQSKRR
jgi:DNA transformation protein